MIDFMARLLLRHRESAPVDQEMQNPNEGCIGMRRSA
jgi:hypothetical protein